MKKLVKGIVEFRKNIQGSYREKFSHLALGQQSPDTLFVACSDSRVVPNVFASTDPGDLFVVRNVGNLVPSFQKNQSSEALEAAAHSEAAAIEFAIERLNVSDVIVCGHSECGAMHALLDGRHKLNLKHLVSWLRHGEGALDAMPLNNQELSLVNQLSQRNVLHQLQHLRSYPKIQARLAKGDLKLHAWWFELNLAEVFNYDDSQKKFVIIEG